MWLCVLWACVSKGNGLGDSALGFDTADADTDADADADTDSDTDSDTDTDTDTGPELPQLASVGGDCTNSGCEWYVVTSGPTPGGARLDIIQNGDEAFDCSLPTDGQLVCGVWTESHDAFAVTEVDGAYTTSTLDILLVDDTADQENNVSSVFDLSRARIGNELTMMFTVFTEDGDYADCARYGYDSSYYADQCENDWD